jgi:hypothetical protein
MVTTAPSASTIAQGLRCSALKRAPRDEDAIFGDYVRLARLRSGPAADEQFTIVIEASHIALVTRGPQGRDRSQRLQSVGNRFRKFMAKR